MQEDWKKVSVTLIALLLIGSSLMGYVFYDRDIKQQARIVDLQSQLGEQRLQISTLELENTKRAIKITSLREEINELRAKIEELKAKIDAKNQEISILQVENERQETEMIGLQEDIDSSERRINELKDNLDELQGSNISLRKLYRELYYAYYRLQTKYEELRESLKPPLPPKIIDKISDMKLYRFLIGMGIPRERIYIGDYFYELTTIAEIKRFLVWDKTEEIPPSLLEEEFDCDDRSARLIGQFSIPGWSYIALGEIWTYTHTYVVFVTKENGKLVLYGVEPLTDEVWKIQRLSVSEIQFIKFT